MASDLKQDYFEWMVEKVGGYKHDRLSYRYLLEELNETSFEFYIDMDENRYADGISLRYRFGYENDIIYPIICKQLDIYDCSVLEMMVALAINCEEHIMYDPEIGNRTADWFWDMVDSLGLTEYSDRHFMESRVRNIIHKFITRSYSYNGSGGLFTLKHPKEDMRNVEIWCQLNWYLDELVDNERR